MSLANHRPRGVREILDASVNFYRENFVLVATVAMIVVVPPAILKFIAPEGLGRLFDIIGNLIIPIGQGGITAIVAAAVERDEKLSVGDAFRMTAGRKRSLVAVQITSGLMVFIGLIFLVVPGLLAMASTAVCVPVVMIELLGYSRAIERSRALARGKFSYALGTLVLAWALVFIVVIGAGALEGFVGIEDHTADFLMDVLLGVVYPVPTIAMTLLYYDLRVQNEGADMEAMLAELADSAPVS